MCSVLFSNEIQTKCNSALANKSCKSHVITVASCEIRWYQAQNVAWNRIIIEQENKNTIMKFSFTNFVFSSFWYKLQSTHYTGTTILEIGDFFKKSLLEMLQFFHKFCRILQSNTKSCKILQIHTESCCTLLAFTLHTPGCPVLRFASLLLYLLS